MQQLVNGSVNGSLSFASGARAFGVEPKEQGTQHFRVEAHPFGMKEYSRAHASV